MLNVSQHTSASQHKLIFQRFLTAKFVQTLHLWQQWLLGHSLNHSVPLDPEFLGLNFCGEQPPSRKKALTSCCSLPIWLLLLLCIIPDRAIILPKWIPLEEGSVSCGPLVKLKSLLLLLFQACLSFFFSSHSKLIMNFLHTNGNMCLHLKDYWVRKYNIIYANCKHHYT